MKSLSFVIPVKDEEKTLTELAEQIIQSCERIKDVGQIQIIFIDDGSTDSSWPVMLELSHQYPKSIRAMRLRRNFGKAIALDVGFKAANGDIVFTLDADLQDNPKEIYKFISKLDEGYDLVSGWKKQRNDPLSKTLPSKFFNSVTSKMTGLKLHDFNCGFKAYKRELIDRLRIYGELHRYIPVLAHDAGFAVAEIEVEHSPRRHGVSKYGIERYIRGFLDLVTVLATTRYLNRPGHMFGGLGVLFGLLGMGILSYLSFAWMLGQSIAGRPLFFLGFLFMIFSIVLVAMGVIAELVIKVARTDSPFNNVVTDTQTTKIES